jgi:hypothetical protein
VCFGLLFAVGEWAFWPAAIVWLAGFVAACRPRPDRGWHPAPHGLAGLPGHPLARARLDWEHIPQPPADPPAAEQPFATDLDLSGPLSLHPP